MSEDASRRLVRIFKEVDWLIPAYMSVGFINEFADAIERTPLGSRSELMMNILPRVYNCQYISSMYIDRYSKTAHVREFSKQINEAIKAYYSGYKHVAILAMIPTLEGIIRKFAIKQSRDVGYGTNKINVEFDKIVEREEKSPYRYEERLAMFEGLRDFIRDRFLKDTRKYDGLDELNRHGILHGIFGKYGEDTNFFRMITLLDLMCFSINMVEGGSGFAPSDSEDSRRLEAHYLVLQARSMADRNIIK